MLKRPTMVQFDAKLAAVATIAMVLAGGPLRSHATVPTTASDDRPASERRFDKVIAENLSRVVDPPIVSDTSDAPFRDRVVHFIRDVAAGSPARCALTGRGAPLVHLYRDGQLVGRGASRANDLCPALKEATRRALAAAGAPKSIAGARFVVELGEQWIVEHEGSGLPLADGMVPVRAVDRALLAAHVDSAARYLTHVVDPQRGGAHKFYYPNTDAFEDVLHTVYSASTALTFLKLYDKNHDARYLDLAKRATRFVLSMQKPSGAFSYSIDTRTGEPDDVLYVGTASKSIFTLLELHEVEAAKRAADWLITMQRPDGSVLSSNKTSKKESLLYTGQVLSALSRVYRATKDPQYLAAAARTAVYLGDKVAAKGCYLGDDYRAPNPISSSWVVMSLLDFDRATSDGHFERVVFSCADALLQRQDRSDDPSRNGRYSGALSSSGNGWVAEVMSETYLHCRRKGRAGCERYRDSVVAASRLLLQHTYSPANAFMTKNPAAAMGGVFWSTRDRYVRTDAVCHATNALLGVIDDLPGGTLVTLPEGALSQVEASDGADGDE